MTIPSDLDPLAAPWWPAKRVARLFKVTPQSLYSWIGPDGLPAVRVSGSWRIIEEVLRCWIMEKLRASLGVSAEVLVYDPLTDQWLTVRELARIFDVSPGTIYGLAKANKIPAIFVGGTWRFPEALLRAWSLDEMKTNKP